MTKTTIFGRQSETHREIQHLLDSTAKSTGVPHYKIVYLELYSDNTFLLSVKDPEGKQFATYFQGNPINHVYRWVQKIGNKTNRRA